MSGLDSLRARIFADAGLTAELAAIEDTDAFIARLAHVAAGFGIAVTEPQLREAVRPDPLGLSRFAPAAVTETGWPPPGFLPMHFSAHGVVDWTYVGPQPLTEPFFEGAIRKAMARPFNRAFRHRMTLPDFTAGATRQQDALMPDGFIFHMSRCGSTLVSQMLAHSVRNIVISEAAPIDGAVQRSHVDILRAMVLALGRRRSGVERRYFIKLDSWHALALPLFERAFPDVPWIFLYRDPLEVMVSQTREPGGQMVPQLVAPSIYGLDAENTIPGPDYTARVLNRICTAAADALASPRGLAINYRDLPEALERRILPHFGVVLDDGERAAMREASRYDAKSPAMTFAADGAAKQAAASAILRSISERHLADIFRRLNEIAATPAAA